MLKRLLMVMKPISLYMLLMINRFVRKLAALSHRAQFVVQWGGTTTPEWFDHYLDLYYLWGGINGNAFWLERGIFSLLAIKQGADVLELCCGDGFNAKYFYSYRAAHIMSCDFDPAAIAYAKRNNQTDKNEFVLADIRNDMPAGHFDNVVWDAAIEHFTPDEIQAIMENIKSRLKLEGVLSGYTIVERADGQKSLSQHEYEFNSKEDLMQFLAPWFRNVRIFETIYSNRHNLYFYASDSVLPFSAEWPYLLDKMDG